jgi:dTDP-4-amino-4,6-dideoxygalactose transaminase
MLIDWDWVVKQLEGKDISGWFGNATGGPYLQEFQTRFAQYCGAKHGIAVCGGSSSIYVALRACGVEPGDYVAVPAYTHIGSVAPIVLASAKPIFIDSDKYGNLSASDLEKAIQKKPNLKAVIPVHLLGVPCEMDKIKDVLANNYDKKVFIIEDASHALGSEYKGKRCGTLGDIGCFSIGGGRTKTIGTGEGGMIVTNDDGLAERCRNIRNHGDRYTDVDYMCFNFRMSELNAVVGLSQMPKLDMLVNWQIKKAEYLLAKLPPFFSVPEPPAHVKSTRYLLGCVYEGKNLSRDEFVAQLTEALARKGIENGVPRKNVSKGQTKLISQVRFYQKFKRDTPFAQSLVERSFWIDWHRYPRTEQEINQLIETIEEVAS